VAQEKVSDGAPDPATLSLAFVSAFFQFRSVCVLCGKKNKEKDKKTKKKMKNERECQQKLCCRFFPS
jgi:hypothetical protein